MSVAALSIIWRNYPNGGGEMLTALALADIANDRGECVFGDTEAEAIAAKTLQSPRAVRYHMKAMQAIGWLVVTGNERGGRGRKLQYRIPLEQVPLGSTERVQKLQPLIDQLVEVDINGQAVVGQAAERRQILPPSEKVANRDRKVANADRKGGKTQHPPNVGYVVHKSTGTAPDGADAFERFWQTWPRTERKVSKSKCLAVWRRKKLDDKIDVIVRHVEVCKKSESWRTGFEPMPLTYLNQERWDGADLDAPASGEKPWFINGWSGIVAKGAEHGLQERDYRTPPEFRAAVLKAAGITAEQVKQAEAEWRS